VPTRREAPPPSRRELRGRPPASAPIPLAAPPDQLPVTQPRGLPSALPAATAPAPFGVPSGVSPRGRRDPYVDELLAGTSPRVARERRSAGATRGPDPYVPAGRDGRRGRGDPEESAALRRKALLAAGLLVTLLSSVYVVNERDARAAEEPPVPPAGSVRTPGAQDPAVQNPAVQDPDGGTPQPTP
jgi:hypothetical protein